MTMNHPLSLIAKHCEILFFKDGDTTDSLAHKYSLRCARLLKTKSSERKKVFEQMKRFYNTRSKIVHGGGEEKEEALKKINLQEIENYIRKSIRLFIEKIKQQGLSQKDIIEDLDYG
jgi:Apea-like HEPN